MLKNIHNEKRKWDLIHNLLENPTQSTNTLAQKTGMNRRTVFRIQDELEKENIIWGYSTVIDEHKLGRVVYLLQFQTKPFTKEFADIIKQQLTTEKHETEQLGIRLLEIYYMDGDYNVLIKFSAPDHKIARAYFEVLRSIYKDHFLDVPLVSVVNTSFIKESKVHPELDQMLHALIPSNEKLHALIPASEKS